MPTMVDDVDLIGEVRLRGRGRQQRRPDHPGQPDRQPGRVHPGRDWSTGCPVGMQIIGRHHEEPLLLELARVVERERPWPLVAPGAPI